LFGHQVKKSFTHNHPILPLHGRYICTFHYPNQLHFQNPLQLPFHHILSNPNSIAAYKDMKHDAKIRIILKLTP
ncbi:family 1 glycosylhydrolase, partial [Bacillus altitudinis]|uniref:family 1 glycosylhydrolase n=1 Tax=Bacillus altitudinis TaxID=293387 RepID=UPI0011A26BC1